MDFPVQMPHDDVPRFESDSVPVLNRTDHGLHGSISDLLRDKDWLHQFTDFHLQMEAVVHRARQETVNKLDADLVSTGDLEMKVLNYFSFSKQSELPKPLIKAGQDSVVLTNKKELKSFQKKEYKNSVKAGASTVKRHDMIQEKISSFSSQQQRSVSANKINNAHTLEALAEKTLFGEGLVIGEEDGVVEDLTEEDLERIDATTNLDAEDSELKVPKAKRKTQRNYNEDIAKHHDEARRIHLFNQDILPFIESCCFAGLVSSWDFIFVCVLSIML